MIPVWCVIKILFKSSQCFIGINPNTPSAGKQHEGKTAKQFWRLFSRCVCVLVNLNITMLKLFSCFGLGFCFVLFLGFFCVCFWGLFVCCLFGVWVFFFCLLFLELLVDCSANYSLGLLSWLTSTLQATLWFLNPNNRAVHGIFASFLTSCQ